MAARARYRNLALAAIAALLSAAAGCDEDEEAASDWAPVESGTAEDLLGIWGSSATDVWAVGDAGAVLRFRPDN